MPVLVRYIIVRLSVGAVIGSVSCMVVLVTAPRALGSPGQWLEIALIMYGFASVFALGFLATALASEGET